MMEVESMENYRILVIEDEEDFNEMICCTFEAAGFQAVAAYDGDDGLKKAFACSPDLIILDVMMPKLDGIGVCRALKSQDETKSIPVIMVTAKSGLSDKLLGYISGARRYIVKPFDLDELVNQVKIALHQQKISGDLSKTQQLDDPRDSAG